MAKNLDISVLPYPGEDKSLWQNPSSLSVEVSEPVSLKIVLGASNNPENELYLDAVRSDNLPVYKRRGGGGTVLLGPGMVIVTLRANVKKSFNNRHYLNLIQSFIIEILYQKFGLKIEPNGISDLTVNNKKILGSSVYRCKEILLYQGVILVEAQLYKIAKYIKHPGKEPGYRNGREHKDFVANTVQFNPCCCTYRVVEEIREAFNKFFYNRIENELITALKN